MNDVATGITQNVVIFLNRHYVDVSALADNPTLTLQERRLQHKLGFVDFLTHL
jgi:hypothetical protein